MGFASFYCFRVTRGIHSVNVATNICDGYPLDVLRHRRETGAAEADTFLTFPAVQRKVSVLTQIQALSGNHALPR